MKQKLRDFQKQQADSFYQFKIFSFIPITMNHLKHFFLSAFLFVTLFSSAQNIERPKLVVGIVVDQMRWDYLYRFYERYAADGGFKRLIQNGYSCDNTLISYVPSITACGHASIYSGSVPAINGITGNTWGDRLQKKVVYCVEDPSVKSVGSNTEAGLMSPRNLLTTSICDELRLATNFRSKVVGIALKDRGSILPAGHSANAAYWYDAQTGDWITSSYYMNDLPKWVKDFNQQKMVDKYYDQNWNTLYPINTYTQSSEDKKSYENKALGAGFPYTLKQFEGKNYSVISTLPYGNSLTAEFAKAAITSENLGEGAATDFLTVSFSSTDYVGHSFGPNSIEAEDTYLRLDKDLGNLLSFLDQKVGKNQYLVFLSADHGAAHSPGFLNEHNIPGGIFQNTFVNNLNTALKTRFGVDKMITDYINYQLYLNWSSIDSAKLDRTQVIHFIIDNAMKTEGIARAFDLTQVRQSTLNAKLQDMISNGFYPNRSGDVQIMMQAQWLDSYATVGTTHGVWNPYDTHIPLLWYGWGIKPGKTNRETYITDIAPTLAALLHIQMPSGAVGKVIEEVKR